MESSIHSYEDVRRKRIEKNLKQLEDLGIAKISKSLLEVAKRESKQLKIHTSFKAKKLLETSELRRSSRMQKEAPSYGDDVRNCCSNMSKSLREAFLMVVDSGNRRLHGLRSSRSEPIGREYTGRIASYEEKVLAQKRAEMLLNQLSTNHPSFVKLMLRSHVSSCFWLGLPTKFCRDHLPLRETKMILEDEEGEEHEAIYIGRRTGLSGGWRSFAVDHKLEDGDALVFKLIGLTRFKIYIVKAIVGSTEAKDEKARFKKPCASTELKETEDSSCENQSSIITIHVPKDKSEELPRKCMEAKAKET